MADASNNADVATAPPVSSPAVKKSKSASALAKKPRVKPTHPPTAEMVNNAIKNLKERGGSSLQAIKKYLSSNYKIDAEKLAPFIKKYLKGAVTNGQLIQTKGKGASGSFKIAASVKSKSTSSRAPKSPAKKAIGEKKAKKEKKVGSATAGGASATKKKSIKKPSATAVAKKPANSGSGEKKKAASTTAKAAKKSGNIKTSSPKQKPTKATKSITKKPKAPKPKKATPAKKPATAPKKAVAVQKKK